MPETPRARRPRRRVATLLGLAFSVGAPCSPGHAEDASPASPEAAVERFVPLAARGDLEGMYALGREPAADPWRIADALLLRGRPDIAPWASLCMPGPDTAGLPAYVGRWRPRPDERTRRSALTSVMPPGPGATDADVDDVLGVLWAGETGRRALLLGDLPRAQAAYLSAAERAWRIGWLAEAGVAFREAAGAARSRERFLEEDAIWARRVTLSEARGLPVEIAKSLNNQALARMGTGRPDEAVLLFERAVRLAKGARDPRLASVIVGNEGMAWEALQAFEKARSCYEEELGLREGLADAHALAGAWVDLLMFHMRRDDPERVVRSWEGGIAIAREHGLLRDEGLLERKIGAYFMTRHDERCVAHLERAAELHAQVGDLVAVPGALGTLAAFHEGRGDLVRSRDAWLRARVAATTGADVEELAISNTHLVQVFQALGDLGEARSAAVAALSLRGALPATDQVALRTNLGTILVGLGEWSKAVASFREAVALARSIGDAAGLSRAHLASTSALLLIGDREGTATAVARAREDLKGVDDPMGDAALSTTEGALALEAGDLAGAVRGYDAALSAAERSGHGGAVAMALLNRATLALAQGEIQGGFARLVRARLRAREAGDRAAAALCLVNLGMALADGGAPRLARAALERGSADATAVGDVRARQAARTALASVRADLGDAEGALLEARAAIEDMESLAARLADEPQARVRERQASVYATGVRAAMAQSDPVRAAGFVESGRAFGLRESLLAAPSVAAARLSSGALAAERDARAREALAERRLREALLIAAATSGPGGRAGADGAVAAAVADHEAARHERRQALERLQEEGKRTAGLLYPTVASDADIRGALRAGEALVSFQRVRGDLVAVVTTPEATRCVALGAEEAARRDLDRFAPDAEPAEAMRIAAAVAGRLVAPLRLPEGIRRVLVSSGGVLRGRRGPLPSPLLWPGTEVVEVPSGTVLAWMRRDGARRGEGVLGVGDARYPLAAASVELAMRGGERLLHTLPATREEVLHVADVSLLGAQATEEAVRAALRGRPRWRAVHFACHADFEVGRQMLSGLYLTPSGDDDGLLTALEVARLSIPADLAFLSACGTGAARAIEGEGPLGLVRAFHGAGVPRVVASAWGVPDEPTRMLVEAFYERWKAGAPPARALLEAQAVVRARPGFEAPRCWAGWVLHGLPD